MNRTALFIAVIVLSSDGTTRAGELPTTTPEAVGLSAAQLAELTPALQKLVDEGKIAGGVAQITRHGKVAYVATFGYRDLASKTPMTADTIFAIASMSKPITSVAVMRLVEQGKVALDDPAGNYIPELKQMRVVGDPKDDKGDTIATVPLSRPITIRHLMSHTSGFSGAIPVNPRVRRTYAQAGVERYHEKGLKTIAEQVERLAKGALAHQPGEGWTYGLNQDVLGRLVEVVSGQTFDEYLQEHICKPLDMQDTFFFVPESKRDRMATIYRAPAGAALSPLPKNYGVATYFAGSGGLFSTARDYTRFAQMILEGGALGGKRILRPETIRAMTTNQVGDLTLALGDGPRLQGMKYGLGFGLEMAPAAGAVAPAPSARRFFWGGAFSTRFWIDPEHDMVSVFLTQVLPTSATAASLVRQKAEAAISD
jgi:CubicO group peptidase (beta-lactamase class C family)